MSSSQFVAHAELAGHAARLWAGGARGGRQEQWAGSIDRAFAGGGTSDDASKGMGTMHVRCWARCWRLLTSRVRNARLRALGKNERPIAPNIKHTNTTWERDDLRHRCERCELGSECSSICCVRLL